MDRMTRQPKWFRLITIAMVIAALVFIGALIWRAAATSVASHKQQLIDQRYEQDSETARKMLEANTTGVWSSLWTDTLLTDLRPLKAAMWTGVDGIASYRCDLLPTHWLVELGRDEDGRVFAMYVAPQGLPAVLPASSDGHCLGEQVFVFQPNQVKRFGEK